MSEAPASTGIGLAARDGVSAGAARTSARYYVCVGVLLVCALTMQTVAQLLGNHFRKAAVPLKRPLAAMDRYKLAPEYTLHIEPPAALPEEMIEWLGTREYLSWRVVDTRHDRADAVNTAHLFITYYTGKPDMVPLAKPVAEVCAVAKKDMKPGEKLDQIGEYCYRAWILEAAVARADKAIPCGLLAGGTVTAPIRKGELITWANAKPAEGSRIAALRAKQDALVLGLEVA